MPKPLLVDTNLAVLLIVGLTGEANIEKHKRLAKYTVEDFRKLRAIVDRSGGLLWCPNVVSETSNFLRYVADPLNGQLAEMLSKLLKYSEEKYLSSAIAADDKAHSRMGITDTVLLLLAAEDAALLTDDLPLYLIASSRKLDAINFNHLRGT